MIQAASLAVTVLADADPFGGVTASDANKDASTGDDASGGSDGFASALAACLSAPAPQAQPTRAAPDARRDRDDSATTDNKDGPAQDSSKSRAAGPALAQSSASSGSPRASVFAQGQSRTQAQAQTPSQAQSGANAPANSVGDFGGEIDAKGTPDPKVGATRDDHADAPDAASATRQDVTDGSAPANDVGQAVAPIQGGEPTQAQVQAVASPPAQSQTTTALASRTQAAPKAAAERAVQPLAPADDVLPPAIAAASAQGQTAGTAKSARMGRKR